MGRGKRGGVHIHSRNKMLTIRWTLLGQGYRLALGLPDTPVNRRAARAQAAEIERDIALEQFDLSLSKYKRREVTCPKPKTSTIELFARFTNCRLKLGTSGQRIGAIYKPLQSNLSRYGSDIDSEKTAREFIDLLRSRQSGRTANQNLSLLQGFGAWCLSEGHWEENWFFGIPRIKQSDSTQNREPFSRKEINLLLQTLKTDPVHYYYYDFAYTLLSLGVRPSECIGLRWKDLDLEKGVAKISETLARRVAGKKSRQRKATKTKARTVIKLTPKLLALLAGRKQLEAKADDLVFRGKRGGVIDDHFFSQKVWRPLCKKAGVVHRPPYVARHTLISHGIEEMGWSLPQAARVAGHRSTRMVEETYGRAIDLPEMPEF